MAGDNGEQLRATQAGLLAESDPETDGNTYPAASVRMAVLPTEMSAQIKAALCALLAGITVTLSACGQSDSASPITVSGQRISRATVTGFAGAIRQGAAFALLSPELSGYTQQASALLIRYHWLIGEARDQGLGVSGAEATHALSARAAASLGGATVYRATLGETGETEAQAQLALAAEVSAQRLRQKIVESVPRPTGAQIQSYYRSHLARFRVPEERLFSLAERIDGPAELASARRAMVEGHVAAGHHYEAEFHELLPRSLVGKPVLSDPDVDRQVVTNAIFSTPLGVVGGPLRYYGEKAIFKVTRIIPGYVKPLSAVSAQIAKQLRGEALASARKSFVERWRSKWTAKTQCASGYVVDGCREYHGRHVSEEDPLSPE
jgi:hypothetical protein